MVNPRLENVERVLDWPLIKYTPPVKGCLTSCLDAIGNMIPGGQVVATIGGAVAGVAINALVGELTITSVASILSDIMQGSLDTSQYWSVFEEMQIDKNGVYQIREDANDFALKFIGHYKTDKINYLTDKLSKAKSEKGTAEWHLCKLFKYKDIILSNNKLNSEQLLTLEKLLHSYEIDQNENNITLKNDKFFKNTADLKECMSVLLDKNPQIKEVLNTIKAGNNNGINGLVSDIPIPQDKNVIHRDKVYAALNRGFYQDNKQVFILKGFGGLGKSTCAAEYGYKLIEEKKTVRWLYAEDGVANDYESLARLLGIDTEKKTPQEIRDLVSFKLSKLNDVLLIFDNVEKLEDIQGYLNTMPKNVKILITTREDISKSYDIIELEPFTESETLNYITKKLDESISEADSKSLISTVGYLPLRLALAVGWLLNISKLFTMLIVQNGIKDLKVI